MVDHPSNCQHCQPSILNFLQLQLDHILGTIFLPISHGIKSQISRNTCWVLEHGLHGNLPLVRTPLLDTGKEDNLHHRAHTDGTGGQVGIIDVETGEHGEVDKFANDEAGGGKHGHAAVLDFGLLEPLDVPEVGEAKGVETYGANETVGLGGVGEEGNRFGHFGIEGGGGGLER